MSRRRREVQKVIDTLLAESEDTRDVALDRVGEVIGAQAFTADEVEAVIVALEEAGRSVTAPPATAGLDLKAVLSAARDIKRETGRRPGVDAIAAKTGLTPDAVRQALGLGRVMGR